MGSCISSASSTSAAAAPAAKVIALDGSLNEYPKPVTVLSVLGPSHKSCFLCSSDSLYFDKHIPALAPGFVLELNQIYFVMRNDKLEYPLSGSDMAALAIKAGSALARDSKKKMMKKQGKDRSVRVMPIAAPFACNMDCAEPGYIVVKRRVGKRPRVKARVAHRTHRSRNNVRLDTIEESEDSEE